MYMPFVGYLDGVLAPEVLRRVRFYFEVIEEGVTLKESMLELDCIILLWIISALIALIAPREGLETVSYWYCCLSMSNLM